MRTRRWIPCFASWGAEAVVWLPVFDTHTARGVLILARCRPLPFARADADLLAAMAYRIGLALEQARRKVQLEQIVRTGREISRHLDESTVGVEAVRLFPSVVGADAAVLVLHDANGVPRCGARFGMDSAWDGAWTRLADHLLANAALAGGEPYSTPDVHDAVEQIAWKELKNCPVRALMAVPIRREEQVQGLLFAMRFSTRSFSPDTAQMASLFAGQTSAALVNARLYRAVRESEQRFSTAFQRSPLAIALTSLPEGKFLDVNEIFLRGMGYTREEMIGRTYQELGIFAAGDDRAALRVERQESGSVYAKECKLCTKSGNILTYLLSISTVYIDGRQCVLSSGIDITERKWAERKLRESEERLNLALAGADLGMWDWNAVTDEVKLNGRGAEMLGYSAEEIAPRVSIWDRLIHPEDLPRVREVLDAHLAGDTPYYETEHRFLTKSGKWIWVLVKGKVMHRDDLGRPLRAVGTCLDITEAKQIQGERVLMEHQRQQVWRAESLSRMAGGIAHHFNNLIGAVMGNLELVLDELPQESNHRFGVAEAMDASRRAAEISQLMLAYLGQSSMKKERLDLVEAAGEALPLLISSVPKNVRLKTVFPPRGPIVLADGVHLKQILANLVANSAEAIGEGDGEIVLEIGEKEAGEVRPSRFFPLEWEPGTGTYACLSVSDTGCGLDAATLERVFDPFFSTKFTGRGLGLSVVLGLVRAHGGAIAVESEPGRGAVFRLLFPELARETPPPRKKETPVAGTIGREGLLLLVDDEPMIRRVVGAQLARLGYEVITACDGVDAVEKFNLRRDEFRMVVLDLVMPVMDGWETLAALRASRPDIPVVLASGYDEAQVMHGDQPERPGAFLHKPFGMKDLIAALDTARGAFLVGDRED